MAWFGVLRRSVMDPKFVVEVPAGHSPKKIHNKSEHYMTSHDSQASKSIYQDMRRLSPLILGSDVESFYAILLAAFSCLLLLLSF